MVSTGPVPVPPSPFEPLVETLPVGAVLFRVHGDRRPGDAFNPGRGSRTRFAPFGEPIVPVLYAAETMQAAVSESILHDHVPGGAVDSDDYERRALSRLVVGREIQLASLLGMGPRKLGIEAGSVTGTNASHYQETVRWAEAARAAGFDGIAYMSRLCNSDRAYVLFESAAVTVDPNFFIAFGDRGPGRDVLTNLCSAVDIDVTRV